MLDSSDEQSDQRCTLVGRKRCTHEISLQRELTATANVPGMVCLDEPHIGFLSLWLVESVTYEGLVRGRVFPEKRVAFRPLPAGR